MSPREWVRWVVSGRPRWSQADVDRATEEGRAWAAWCREQQRLEAEGR